MQMPPNLPWLTQEVYDKMPATERALMWAASQVGVEEAPGHNNRGQKVEEYLKSCGLSGGYPWCAAFVRWCLLKAGVDPKKATEFGAAVIGDYHAAGKQGALRTLPQRGFLGGFLNKDGTGHIYFITDVNGDGSWQTIEGNTNDDGSREGYKVARKKRSRNSKVFFIDTAVLIAS